MSSNVAVRCRECGTYQVKMASRTCAAPAAPKKWKCSVCGSAQTGAALAAGGGKEVREFVQAKNAARILEEEGGATCHGRTEEADDACDDAHLFDEMNRRAGPARQPAAPHLKRKGKWDEFLCDDDDEDPARCRTFNSKRSAGRWADPDHSARTRWIDPPVHGKGATEGPAHGSQQTHQSHHRHGQRGYNLNYSQEGNGIVARSGATAANIVNRPSGPASGAAPRRNKWDEFLDDEDL